MQGCLLTPDDALQLGDPRVRFPQLVRGRRDGRNSFVRAWRRRA